MNSSSMSELTAGTSQPTLARGRCSERLAGSEAYLPVLEVLDSLLHRTADLLLDRTEVAMSDVADPVAKVDAALMTALRLFAEHRTLAYLAGRLRPGADGGEAATVSEWIATLFAGHVAKENDLLLPALADSGADLAALLADTHEPPSPRPASA